MKRKTKRKMKYILLIILVIALITTIVFFIKNKKSIKASNNYKEELTTEEISEELEESIENLIQATDEIEEAILENTKAKNDSKNASTDSKPSYNNGKTYYIMVNYGANVVTIYSKDANGEYTIPYKAMICSCGSATPTSGVYTIKGRWRWLSLIGGVHGQYATQIVGNILFHSVPYTAKSPDCLEYWEYDKLRTNCISRMC